MIQRISELESPPRPVALDLRIRNLFGGVISFIGWIFLLVGMIFSSIFLPGYEVVEDFQLSRSAEIASGVVREVRDTNVRINEQSVYEVDFLFTAADSQRYFATSYARGIWLDPGDRVSVEFLPGDPDVARIEGTDRSQNPIWLSFILIFPLIGLFFVSAALRVGRHANELLRNGLVTVGRLSKKEPTNTKINEQTVFRLVFQYQAEGESFEREERSHLFGDMLDDREELMLYHRDNPSRAVVLDGISGDLQVSAEGGWQIGEGFSFRRLILPLLLPGAAFLFAMLRILYDLNN